MDTPRYKLNSSQTIYRNIYYVIRDELDEIIDANAEDYYNYLEGPDRLRPTLMIDNVTRRLFR